jgi:hypothetical protein
VDPDPDLGGPKTRGSGSGFGSGSATLLFIINYFFIFCVFHPKINRLGQRCGSRKYFFWIRICGSVNLNYGTGSGRPVITDPSRFGSYLDIFVAT